MAKHRRGTRVSIDGETMPVGGPLDGLLRRFGVLDTPEADQCRLVLVLCCEGLQQRPAHGHNPTPVCSCGWIGTEHRSKLGAELEWLEDHRYPDDDKEMQ